MSYKITVYFNDEDIESTKIYYPNGGFTVNREYGSTQYIAEGFDGTTQFTAYPADGCVFTRWLYRIGEEIYDESIPPRETDDNPFSYTGTEELVIRAEGEREYVEPPWGDEFEEGQIINVTTSQEYVDIYNPKTGTYQLEPYTIHRYTVVFAYSGYAHFFTESDIDTIGYLSDEADFNSDFSGPLSTLDSDDDSGDGNNFDIKCNVKANTPYYIFVRGRTGEESGSVTLWVTEPWQLNSSNYGTLYGENTESITIKTKTL